MNKQELIDKLKNDLTAMSEIKGKKYEYDKGYERAIKEHLVMITALDWPEKPVVPQFVAEFYESIKYDFEWGLYKLCIKFHEQKLRVDFHRWFDDVNNKSIETLVLMHKFGYEVDKVKYYEVYQKRTGIQLGVCVPHGEDKTHFTKVELQEYGFDDLDVYDVKEVEK